MENTKIAIKDTMSIFIELSKKRKYKISDYLEFEMCLRHIAFTAVEEAKNSNKEINWKEIIL